MHSTLQSRDFFFAQVALANYTTLHACANFYCSLNDILLLSLRLIFIDRHRRSTQDTTIKNNFSMYTKALHVSRYTIIILSYDLKFSPQSAFHVHRRIMKNEPRECQA